jgi:uncharacterized protein (TIGR02598 family)
MKHKRKTMGFTLVEVLISLGITASALLILVGFIAYIMDTSRSSQGESIAVLISNQVRTRLLTNPAWPPGTENRALSRAVDEYGMTTDSFTWDALYFDDQGIELNPTDAEDAIYQAILHFRRSPNYNSPRLDFITLAVRDVKQRKTVAEFTYQRARKKERPGR